MPLEWRTIEQKPVYPFGLYASENWRKLVLAAFFADLISYPQLFSQVNFDRLLFVMHAFPQGFRTWWIKFPNGVWWPAGYSGWYPMGESTYECFAKHPEKLVDRMIVPHTYSAEQKPYLYLFNYSAIPALKKSSFAKALIKEYVQDISQQNARGLACITVSADGARIAKRFGMSCAGYLELGGCLEGVYTTETQKHTPA